MGGDRAVFVNLRPEAFDSRGKPHFKLMAGNKPYRLAFNLSESRPRLGRYGSGRATAALTKAVGDFWYTVHVITPSRVMANPGALTALPGLFVPVARLNYTICVRG
jgi:hypothetical protein